MKLVCKMVGNVDTNCGKYDNDILIRLNLRTSNSHILDTYAGNVIYSIKVWGS